MSYTPDESSTDLFTERSLINGTVVTGIAYGIHFTLFTMCAHLLIKNGTRKSRNWFFLLYISVMFILGTLFLTSSMKVNQLTFIDDRNFPGGPAAFNVVDFSIPINLLGNVVFVIANWLADGLMLWRCMVIHQDTCVWLVMIFPCLLFVGTVVTSIFLLVQVSQPGLSLWTKTSVNFALPYWTLSLSLNVIVTILIVVRLLIYKRHVTSTLGKQHGNPYTSIAAMIVESSLLYSSFSLLFLVPFAVNSPIQNAFLQVLGQIQIISPLLIIYRVARGRGWSSGTAAQRPATTKTDICFGQNLAPEFMDASATILESGGTYPMESRDETISRTTSETK